MPKLSITKLQDRKIKRIKDKFYSRQSEIEIKLDGRLLFRGHKDDSVVNGIIRANPGCVVEWVDKSRVDDPREFMRGIK